MNWLDELRTLHEKHKAETATEQEELRVGQLVFEHIDHLIGAAEADIEVARCLSYVMCESCESLFKKPPAEADCVLADHVEAYAALNPDHS